MKSKSPITRRDFVKTAAVGAAAAATFSPLGAIQALGEEQAPRERVKAANEYDYIVIGSGAGGGTVACRLAQGGKHVLLLEAGSWATSERKEYPIFDNKEPTAHAWASEDPALAWGFYVKHYQDRQDARGRMNRNKRSPYIDQQNPLYDQTKQGILYPRGSTIGGSTAVNALITLYPDGEDWNAIGRRVGDEQTWNARNMYRYFRRFDASYSWTQDPEKAKLQQLPEYWRPWFSNERASIQPVLDKMDTMTLRIAFAAFWGTFLSDSRLQYRMLDLVRKYSIPKIPGLGHDAKSTLFTKNFARELLEIVHAVNPNTWDYVTDMTEGMVDIPKATLRGKRFGTRDLIEDTMMRHNLFVHSSAFVTEIQIDRALGGPKAVGVEFVRGQSLYGARRDGAERTPAQAKEYARVKPGGEVILAGGAINTPQLLNLSGIGNTRDLEAVGIRPKVDLPAVGTNLQDRYEVTLTYELPEELGILSDCKMGEVFRNRDDRYASDVCYRNWLSDPSSSIYGTNGVIAAMAKKSSVRVGSPDMIIFGLSGDFPGYETGYSKRVAKRKDLLTWAILKGHTDNNAGYVKLKSKIPFDTPVVNFMSFEDGYNWKNRTNIQWQDDVDALLDGVKHVRENLRTEFPGFGKDRPTFKEMLPKPKDDGSDHTDAELEGFIKQRAWGHHACGTAPMGRKDSEFPKAAVDSNFRVHGVKGLRIVDASIFPRIPGLFIVVPTYLIAEKAAATILGQEREEGRGGR